jgi:3-dehydroquinate synthase
MINSEDKDLTNSLWSKTLPWLFSLLVTVSVLVTTFLLFEALLLEWLSASQWESMLLTTVAAVGALSLDILLPIPSSVIAVKVSTVMGGVPSFWIIWFGLSLSTLLGYWLGKYGNEHLLKRFISAHETKRAKRYAEQYGIFAIMVLRGVPILAETSVIAAGAMGMPLHLFILGTFTANACVALVYAVLGATAVHYNAAFFAVLASAAIPLAGIVLIRLNQKVTPGLSGVDTSEQLAVKEGVSVEATDDSVQSLQVTYDYKLCFTSHVFNINNSLLADIISQIEPDRQHKIAIYIDSGLAESSASLIPDIKNYIAHFSAQLSLLGEPMIVESGEGKCK